MTRNIKYYFQIHQKQKITSDYHQYKKPQKTRMQSLQKIQPCYTNYKKLSQKQKQSLISKAQQCEENRRPNPQGIHQFQQYSFIPFQVMEDNKAINLQTYRYNAQGPQPIKAVIIMFHGLNSYMGHGAHLAYWLSKAGITTVGFDYRGFGRSEGRPGYVDNLDLHLQDCSVFVEMIRKIYPGVPLFLLGLSMGGMTAYYLSLKSPELFDGAILMAPALKNIISSTLVKITGILQSLLPDKAKLAKPVYGKASKNPQITQFIKTDKYAFSGRMSLSTIQMIISTMEKSPQTFSSYRCPFMIIQGGLDKLVNPDIAFQLYDNSKTKPQDKQLLFYETMWHDVWHEEEIWDILDRVVAWVQDRVAKKGQGHGEAKGETKDGIKNHGIADSEGAQKQ